MAGQVRQRTADAALRRWRPAAAALLLAAISIAARSTLAPPSPPPLRPLRPLRVAVSIAPAAYFVERLAGPLATVAVMVPPGAEEETWSPTPRQLAALRSARLYVAVGHPAFAFESATLLPFVRTRPEIRVVSMAAGLGQLPLARRDPRLVAADPHVWLAPAPVAVAVRAIAAGLAAVDPPHAALYSANLRLLEGDVAALDAAFRRAAAGPARVRFISYHPAFGYLASEYGFEQLIVEANGKEPGPASLATLVETAHARRIRLVLVPAGLPPRLTASLAAAVGGQVVTVDYMARDWLAMMRRLATLLAETASHA